MTRGLVLALQFLTRLPVPSLHDVAPGELSRSAAWFPLVGLIVGGASAALLVAGGRLDPWLGALLATLGWVWVTGALHLDGLADLADALGAAHRDRTRFLQVLRDPHVGTFGVIALVAAIGSRFVLLALLLQHSPTSWRALPLIAAWARLGAIAWSAWLPALAPGSAERFAWHISRTTIVIWAIALAGVSVLVAPHLLLAPLAIVGWGGYLKRRVGGVTGDCLGAGVEIIELVLLLAAVFRAFATSA